MQDTVRNAYCVLGDSCAIISAAYEKEICGIGQRRGYEIMDGYSNIVKKDTSLVEVTEGILSEARTDFTKANSISMPIAELAILGAGVSSLIPALRTVTETAAINTQGLFQLANAGVGDALKAAGNGNFWGAFKTAEGTSKLAQLKAAEPLSMVKSTALPVNPATMMMAVALFSMEQQLGNITEMTRQILSFLETEKQAEIEADVEILVNILSKYKYNWDNEQFISGNYKLVLDIQRTARKHMISHQKRVNELLHDRKKLVSRGKLNDTLGDIQKKFTYYRLSLYSFAMASLIEIMLSGNVKEEYISGIVSDIEKFSMQYREEFMEASLYLEKLSKASLETNFLKGTGVVSRVIGQAIGSIPIVREGRVDELLQESGARLRENAEGVGQDVLAAFAANNNPGTRVFIDKMKDMIQIYNHTSNIFFDEKQIYLVADL
ncbi:MAG: hypothetical protein HFI42_08680 [Lachnospiraceae bacterium]|nr:hypothetical protein [Lachnospiraceae bacterium]MCI9150564.1 hypothetical protein [Lachnospiraceae bacterium]